MLSSGKRKRVRPSPAGLALSTAVLAGALAYSAEVFHYYVYLPVAVGAAIALAVLGLRLRGLRSGLPEPYGKGSVSRIDAKAAARSGLLFAVLGIVAIVGVFGSVFFLPAIAFFSLVFGVTVGLPMEELLFFSLVSRIERASGTRIFRVTEEVGQGGEEILENSIVMIPVRAGK